MAKKITLVEQQKTGGQNEEPATQRGAGRQEDPNRKLTYKELFRIEEIAERIRRISPVEPG